MNDINFNGNVYANIENKTYYMFINNIFVRGVPDWPIKW